MKKYNYIKCDTEENWTKAVNFVPAKDEMIVYSGIVENGHYITSPRFKFGDGVTKINDLPFVKFENEYSTADCTLILGGK